MKTKWALWIAASASWPALGQAPPRAAEPGKAAMTLTSPAFEDGGEIPKDLTSDGKDRSPPLAWDNVPAKARELALVVDDPDASGKEPWVHWIMFHIHPSAVQSLNVGTPTSAALAWPKGAVQGKNSWGTAGYRGPQPPAGGGWHHYHFKLYALDTQLKLDAGATKKDLAAAMQGHVLQVAELVGKYKK